MPDNYDYQFIYSDYNLLSPTEYSYDDTAYPYKSAEQPEVDASPFKAKLPGNVLPGLKGK